MTSHSSVTQKYALGEDPSQWARTGSPEPDGTSFSPTPPLPLPPHLLFQSLQLLILYCSTDYLHMPDEKRGGGRSKDSGSIFTVRGLMNLGCLFILILALLMLLYVLPFLPFFTYSSDFG